MTSKKVQTKTTYTSKGLYSTIDFSSIHSLNQAKINAPFSNSSFAIPTVAKKEFDQKECEKLSALANNYFLVGTKATYLAIGCIYIWCEKASQDTEYYENAIGKKDARKDLTDFHLSIKYCLQLDKSQAPLVTKYYYVLEFIKSELAKEASSDTDVPEAYANKIAKIIKDSGGIDSCARQYRKSLGSDDSEQNEPERPKRLSNDEVEKIEDDYLNKGKAIGSFDNPNAAEDDSKALFIMIGRKSDSKVEVVDKFTNDELIKLIIRKKAE